MWMGSSAPLTTRRVGASSLEEGKEDLALKTEFFLKQTKHTVL
jgi:hypothetical protein